MLDLKPEHKIIKEYYKSLRKLSESATKETAVRGAFERLLEDCSKKLGLHTQAEYTPKYSSRISIDGAILDYLNVPLGYWEAKDIYDDLAKEINNKFERGYPKNNIIFWTPERIILYQNSQIIFDNIIRDSEENLIQVLKAFFEFRSEPQITWEKAVENFKSEIPQAATGVIKLIETERKENPNFKDSFSKFSALCRSSINKNLSDAAIEEMLVQHLLTERIFSTIFNAHDFVRRNVIAREIENVIDSLTSRKFSRQEFLAPLDHFYTALENRAKTLDSYQQKQTFLNSVYEKFFQVFSDN
ncbi:MAG: hypothetical protein P4L38_08980 [Syntrophaceae bacterium]|nr:hypothetical protein [Syntrophaceae bacterium]